MKSKDSNIIEINGIKYVRIEAVKEEARAMRQEIHKLREKSAKSKKKAEFVKIFIPAVSVFCGLCIVANYTLAFRNATNINEGVTCALVGTILGSVLAYCIKSYKEKNSRNENGVDENGRPYPKYAESNGRNNGDDNNAV